MRRDAVLSVDAIVALLDSYCKGLSSTEMNHRLHFRWDYKVGLSYLIKTGEVRLSKRDNKRGRPTIMYRLAKYS